VHASRTQQMMRHARRPRPVFDFMHSMSTADLAEYADAEFRKRMTQTTPDMFNSYYTGKFPGKEHCEWSSVDVGRCAYIIHAVKPPCQSYFQDCLNGFMQWYSRLDELQKEKIKALDRTCCVQEQGVQTANLTWSEAWDVLRCMSTQVINWF